MHAIVALFLIALIVIIVFVVRHFGQESKESKQRRLEEQIAEREENSKPFGDIPSKEEYWQNREKYIDSLNTNPSNSSSKSRNPTSGLRGFFVVFIIISIIFALGGVINMVNSVFFFGFWLADAIMLILSSLFIASWGVLLQGIAKLIEKKD